MEMTDNTQIEEAIEPLEDQGADHPQAGIASEGWSSPQQDADIAEGHLAKLILKRNGAETDIEFPINPPALIGRFDPSIGPIDVDLGNLDEATYISRKHAKIVYEDDVWKVSDLGSSNGTFVLKDDFERVDETELEDGTEIALGNARFVFRLA
jgi:hypothetical protein